VLARESDRRSRFSLHRDDVHGFSGAERFSHDVAEGPRSEILVLEVTTASVRKDRQRLTETVETMRVQNPTQSSRQLDRSALARLRRSALALEIDAAAPAPGCGPAASLFPIDSPSLA
jgi:hypothetical protein